MEEQEQKPEQEIDFAAQWMQRAKERAAAAPTALIDLAGFQFIGRRVELQTYLKANLLPSALVTPVVERLASGRTQEEDVRLTPEAYQSLLEFQRTLMRDAVVKPQIVMDEAPLQPGQVRFTDVVRLDPDLPDRIFVWVFEGCPGVPVATKGGATSVQSLQEFHQEESRGEPPASSPDGEQVQQATE